MPSKPRDRDRRIQHPDVSVERKKWDELLAHAHKLEHAHVKVGVLVQSGGEERHEDGDLTLIEIAAIHEFGSEEAGIPERSFIRRTFDQRVRTDLIQLQTALAREVVTKGMDPEKALSILGSWGSNEVKNTITEDDIPPPLKQATIDAKGSSKPLVDTGQLKNSISYQVVNENEAMADSIGGGS